MTWTHRVIEHRLTPDRRRGLEQRVGEWGPRAAAFAGGVENRREGERRMLLDRRTAIRH